MTEQEKQQLSRDVADKYGIDAFTQPFEVWDWQAEEPLIWLHDDSARCFDLMVEHEVGTKQLVNTANGKAYSAEAFAYNSTNYDIEIDLCEHYTDHNNDKQEATRIAILKALLAKGEI